MNELNNLVKDKAEVFAEKEIQTKLVYLGSIKPHKGHKVFELDTNTGDVKEAEFEATEVHFQQKGTPRKRIVIKKGCQYVSALNKKNAIKKFYK